MEESGSLIREQDGKMSALFQIFKCAFCLLQLVLLLGRRCRGRPRLIVLFKVPIDGLQSVPRDSSD